MRTTTRGALLVILMLAGCAGELSGGGDAGTSPRDGSSPGDAATRDGSSPRDGGAEDARVDAADLDGAVPRDAWRELDGSSDLDAWLDEVDASAGVDAWMAVDASTPLDSGPRDSGPRDSGPRDSGPRDSGPRDSGPRDSGPMDSGPRDSGPRDSGRDAGPFRSSPLHNARAIGYLGSPQGFWEYLPPSAADGPSPLLIFFHGVGEGGDGSVTALNDVLVNGPPRFLEADQWPEARPFIVLSPQNPSTTSCPTAARITAFLAWAIANYDVDTTRMYLTGLSCGAIGIASYMRTYVDTTEVAAIVPISGDWRSTWTTQMCDLGRVPMWALHGELDTHPAASTDFTRIPITSLIACPQPPREDVVLTILPGAAHNDRAWDDTYSMANGHDIYTWMLAHSRP